jgi:hypothetical protein
VKTQPGAAERHSCSSTEYYLPTFRNPPLAADTNWQHCGHHHSSRGRLEDTLYTRHQTLYTRHHTPHTTHYTPDTIHQIPDTRHQTPDTYTPDTTHQTLYTRHQTPDTRHYTPGRNILSKHEGSHNFKQSRPKVPCVCKLELFGVTWGLMLCSAVQFSAVQCSAVFGVTWGLMLSGLQLGLSDSLSLKCPKWMCATGGGDMAQSDSTVIAQ